MNKRITMLLTILLFSLFAQHAQACLSGQTGYYNTYYYWQASYDGYDPSQPFSPQVGIAATCHSTGEPTVEASLQINTAICPHEARIASGAFIPPPPSSNYIDADANVYTDSAYLIYSIGIESDCDCWPDGHMTSYYFNNCAPG